MKGDKIEDLLLADPDLLAAWELYQLCREQQLIIYEKPTGKKDGSKTLTTIVWPSGFSVLPEGTGVLGEDFIRLKYFHGFLQGERQGVSENMKRRGR